jgi:hypothetical protein
MKIIFEGIIYEVNNIQVQDYAGEKSILVTTEEGRTIVMFMNDPKCIIIIN